MDALMQIGNWGPRELSRRFYSYVWNVNYMIVADGIPVFKAFTIGIIGFKVLPYPSCCSLWSLVASFIYPSSDLLLRHSCRFRLSGIAINAKLSNILIRIAKAEYFGVVLIDARGYADIRFILTRYLLQPPKQVISSRYLPKIVQSSIIPVSHHANSLGFGRLAVF